MKVIISEVMKLDSKKVIFIVAFVFVLTFVSYVLMFSGRSVSLDTEFNLQAGQSVRINNSGNVTVKLDSIKENSCDETDSGCTPSDYIYNLSVNGKNYTIYLGYTNSLNINDDFRLDVVSGDEHNLSLIASKIV